MDYSYNSLMGYDVSYYCVSCNSSLSYVRRRIMDRIKLWAAIVITIIILAVVSGIAWLIEKTDWLILLVIILVWIVGVVYCSL